MGSDFNESYSKNQNTIFLVKTVKEDQIRISIA